MDKDPSADAWFYKGNILSKEKGEFKEAIACYDEATALKPDHDMAWFNKGIAFGKVNRVEEALFCMDKVLKINPKMEKAKKVKKELMA